MVSMSVVLCVQVFDLISDHVSLQELKFCLNSVVKSYKSNSVLLLVIRQEACSENLACAKSQDEPWEGSADKTQGLTLGCMQQRSAEADGRGAIAVGALRRCTWLD